jgi:diguanylate cyclase (GGDEF)-like protein
MRSCLRSTDTVARIGGDEFAIIFPETTESQAHVALATVTKRLAKIYPPGVSVGVNELETHIASVHDLLERSDKAMYHAKRASRSTPGEPTDQLDENHR